VAEVLVVDEVDVQREIAQAEGAEDSRLGTAMRRARDRSYARQNMLAFTPIQGEVVPRWFRHSVSRVRHTYAERRPPGRSMPPGRRNRTAEPRAGDDSDPHLADVHPRALQEGA
jgi:hypothetical protein